MLTPDSRQGPMPRYETHVWDRAARRSEQLADDLETLQHAWRERTGRPRADSSAESLITALSGQPVVTVEMAARLTGRSIQAANTALNQLERAGVVKNISAGKWRRAFEASEVITLLNAFELELAISDGKKRPARPAPERGRGGKNLSR